MPTSELSVDVLIQQLHSEDWMARCDAARLLGQSGDPRAVDALLPDLNDPDWRIRRNAAQALGALRDPRAVEPLLHAIRDRTLTVRQRTIVALGRIKDPRALPALLEIVLENRRESYEAAKALRKFGKKALPEIVKAFQRTHNQDLMMLLLDMKYQGALDILLPLMESPQPSVRSTAIHELGNLGNKQAVPHLIDRLNDRDPLIQGEVVRALGKLGALEASSAMLNLLKDDELYGPYSNVYHAITEAFQMFGDVTEEIKKAFPGKYPAMFNMGGAPLSLPEAMGLLGHAQSDILSEAISRLQHGIPKPADTHGLPADLVNKMLEDMQWKFGVMMADARDAKQDRVKRLIELLNSDTGIKRAAAALSLVWYAEERSVEPLRRLLQDSDETVRRAAAWAVSALQKALTYRNQFGL
jgi:HEAT repeat protein